LTRVKKLFNITIELRCLGQKIRKELGMKKQIMVLVFILVLGVFSYGAGEVNFRGLVQTWFSYAERDGGEDIESGYGFTLRRLRFIPHGNLGKNVKWGIMLGWDRQVASLFEAYLDFQISDSFKIKVGQFTAPGSMSSSLSPTSKLDLIERAQITQKWAGNSGLYGYRAFGVQAYGDLMKGKLYYAVMLANPKTLGGIFTPRVSQSIYAVTNNGLGIWGRLEIKPTKCLRLGVFGGSSKENETEMERSSYGAHIFFVKKHLNFKTEYVAGEHGIPGAQKSYNGFYALLGYKQNKIEPVLRYDFFEPENGVADQFGVEKYTNFTFGINYFYSKRIKFQINYVIRDESMALDLEKLKNNLFYIHLQYTF